MTPLVLVIVGVSALLHALWNVLLKTTGDPLRTSGRLLVAGTVVYLPVAVAAWLLVGRPGIPAEAVALGVVSGFLQALYFVLLSSAYRRGDLSVVYPIARGSAPLFAVLAGVLLLGERLELGGWLGVAALLAAVVLLQRPWALLRGRDLREHGAIWFSLATGLAIASYSSVDRVGARLVEPWLFAAIFYPLSAVFLLAWIALRGRTSEERLPPAPWPRAALTGVISLVAYLLILFAYTMAPLTVVVPLRESAVVLVSAWASVRLREATDPGQRATRVAAAALVVLGVGLLALD